jgi:acetolactate synthase-1/2/3 large subunit
MNTKSTNLRNGGQILVEALSLNAVNTVYCVPGESYLPVLDALHQHSNITTINTRHEGAASNMGEAYGKMTGQPGIVFVTRGPGATHAANGVHTAMQDSTPMILFIGQVGTEIKEREGFQEIDYRQMFGGMAKWATEIESIERIPEVIQRAINIAMSGRKGPVVIALPENVLFGSAEVADVPPAIIAESFPDPKAISRVEALVNQAKKPLVIVGGTGWTREAQADLKAFVHQFNLPVAAGFRRQDILDNRDEHYIGQLGLGISAALADYVQQADLIIAIGSRLSEITSGAYELIKSPLPIQKLIHAHVDPSELNRVFHAELPICASVGSVTASLARLSANANKNARKDWTEAGRKNYISHNSPIARSPEQTGVELSHVVSHLSNTLPDDAIISNGAGNYTVWVHRFFQYKQLGTELASTNGAMGYGLPAAIAAKIEKPQSTVVCFAGDGCFMMYPQELATAIQFNAPIIIIVVNNEMLGTIRMHQEREYPGRISATNLVNPNFVDFAKSFGAYAERVDCNEGFAPALERALASGRPALLELRTDPAQITPQGRLQN